MPSQSHLVLFASDSIQMLYPVGVSPVGEKCLLGNRLFYLNDAHAEQFVVEDALSATTQIESALIEMPDSTRALLVRRGLVASWHEIALRANLHEYIKPRLVRTSKLGGSEYAVVRFWLLDRTSSETELVLTSSDALFLSTGDTLMVEVDSLLKQGFSIHAEGTLKVGSTYVIPISRSTVSEDSFNPLFAEFSPNNTTNTLQFVRFLPINLPVSYRSGQKSYLNSGGITREHYSLGLITPYLHDLRTGETFDWCPLLTALSCPSLIDQPGTHYWLSDFRPTIDGKIIVAFEGGKDHLVYIVDPSATRVVKTYRLQEQIQFASMALISDKAVVAISTDGRHLIRWTLL